VHIVGSIPAAVAGGSDREDENLMDIHGYHLDIHGYHLDIHGYTWISFLDIQLDIIWIHIGYLEWISFGYVRMYLGYHMWILLGYQLDSFRILKWISFGYRWIL
jgi:hypothetical protein